MTLTDHPNTSPNSTDVAFLARFVRETWDAYRPEDSAGALLNWCPPPDDGDDDGKGKEGKGKGKGKGGEDPDDDDDDDGDPDDEDEDDDGGKDDDEDDEAAQARRENAALKKRLAKSERARKKAERDAKRQKDKEREDAGEYKEMYEEQVKETEALRKQIRDGAFDRAVEAAAKSLRFRDPEDAVRMVDNDLRQTAVDEDGVVDEDLVARALKKVAKTRDYLLLPEERPQGRVRGDRDNSGNGNGGKDGYQFNPRGKMRGAYDRSSNA